VHPSARRLVVLTLTLALAPGFLGRPALAAPAPFDFYDRGPYRAGVPRPAEVLGYEPGTFHTAYGQMERYVDALLHAAPDRVVREPFGRTYEFRERALLAISSPENLRRLDAIREAGAKLADPRLASVAETEKLARETPATVWLNYSIHGDESASFEAMMQVAFQLAAGEDSTTRAIRERCLVLVNLAHNPDGHERFVTWVNALGSGDPEPFAIEQQWQQPWGIGGRTNHYQVDLNRDALAMSQIESRQMAREFQRWHPQVFVDHHGQTATYFFDPPASPLNPVLPGAQVMRWTEAFGRANAAAFDRYGWNYFLRDRFDLFYPGYWDSWPSLQGAVGMTYETDGGGNLAIRRDDETVVTLLDGIRRHFTASLATCAAAAANREALFADFRACAAGAVEEGRRGPVRAIVLDAAPDPVRAASLAENLLQAGVEVRWVAKPFKSAEARPLWGDPPSAKRGRPAGAGASGAGAGAAKSAAKSAGRDSLAYAPAGSRKPYAFPAAPREFAHGVFVVDLAQPNGRLARTLLEREAPMDSAYERLQLEKYERNLKRGRNAPKERYDFYDITAWSLAVSYGVPAFAVRDLPAASVLLAASDPNAPDEAPAGSTERLPDSLALGIPLPARLSRWAPLALRDAAGGVALDLLGRVEGGEAATAYVWSCAEDGAARLALRLLQEDFKVATATRPLRADGRDFPRGSFVARIERNPESLHGRIAALARGSGVKVAAVNSAWTDRGDTGIGSEVVRSLKRPRIAVLVDRPVSPNSYGWLWFLFERRLGLRFTALRASALARAELDRYNTVIVPDGDPNALAEALGEGGVARLKNWVQRGGVLVCMEDAAEFPTLDKVGLSTARAVGVKPAGPKPEGYATGAAGGAGAGGAGSGRPGPPDTTDAEAERRPQYVPGTVFMASPDPRHFLCYGLGESRVPVLIEGQLFLKASKEGSNPLVFDRAPLALAGWTWPETERRLLGCAYAVDEPTGGGHVLMLAGAPGYRLFWPATERILLNALVYAPALD
jgi:hypothetical protein